MLNSETLGALALALSKAQAEFLPCRKLSDNPFFKSKYADLAEVIDATRPALTKNELSVMQLPSFDGEKVTVTTLLAHSSGEFISCDLSSRPTKPDSQGVGSTVTYLRRYGMSSLLAIAAESDDDGERACGRDTPVVVQQKPRTAVASAPVINHTVADSEYLPPHDKDSQQADDYPSNRRRGRPAGSPNKPKVEDKPAEAQTPPAGVEEPEPMSEIPFAPMKGPTHVINIADIKKDMEQKATPRFVYGDREHHLLLVEAIKASGLPPDQLTQIRSNWQAFTKANEVTATVPGIIEGFKKCLK